MNSKHHEEILWRSSKGNKHKKSTHLTFIREPS